MLFFYSEDIALRGTKIKTNEEFYIQNFLVSMRKLFCKQNFGYYNFKALHH